MNNHSHVSKKSSDTDEQCIKKCSYIHTNQTLKLEESKRSFYLEKFNGTKTTVISVDKCLFLNKSKGCDFVIEHMNSKNDPEHAIYLELKGKDINSAYCQIEETLKFFQNRHSKIKKNHRICIIICSRFPPRTTPSRLRAEKKIHKIYNATPHPPRETTFSYTLPDLTT